MGSYQVGSTQRDRAGDLPRSAAAGGCIAALEPSGLTTALEVGWPGSGSPRRAPLERRSGSLALAALRPCYRLCRRTVPSTKSVGATDSAVQREDQQGTQTRPSRRLIALVAASCAVAVEAARATAALRPSERAARQSLRATRALLLAICATNSTGQVAPCFRTATGTRSWSGRVADGRDSAAPGCLRN